MKYLQIIAMSLLVACGANPAGDDDDVFADGGDGFDDAGGSLVDGGPGRSDAEPGRSDAGPICQANLMIDRTNCGFCGHDCLDLGCSEGSCGSSSISLLHSQVAGVMTDNIAAYYTVKKPDSTYEVVRNPFSGSKATIAIVRGPSLPQQLSMDLGSVYHTDTITAPDVRGMLRKTSKASGGTSNVIADFQPSARGAIVHSDGVTYWGTINAEIRMIADGSSEIIPIDSTGIEVDFIAQDNLNLYWVTRFDSNPGLIGRTAKDGSSNAVLANLPFGKSTSQVSVDDTHLYWKNQQGEVLRVTKAGGTPQVIATNQPTSPLPPTGNIKDTINSAALVADGIIYWTAGGQIRAQPVGGGPVQILVDLGDDSEPCPVNGLIEELYAGAAHIYFIVAWDKPCGTTDMQVHRIPQY